MTTQKIYFSRSQALVGLCAAASFSLLIDYLLLKSLGNGQLIPAMVLVLLALVTLFTMLACGRNAFFPPLLYEVTNEGLTSYFDAERGQLRPTGHLVPWAKIERVSAYEEGRISALQIDLAPGHGLPVAILSILKPGVGKFGTGQENKVDWENTVFLRSETDFGSLQELATELENKRIAR